LGTKFNTLPLFFQPYTFLSNIPEMGVNLLILNWEVLSEMYLGNIKSWNDSRLVELNPLLSNVNKPIVHVLRNTNNSATNYLTTIYSSLSTEWNEKHGVVTSWPDLNVPKIITSTNVFATFAEVFANEYTFSYGSYPFFNTIGSESGVNCAGFKKPNGEIIYPSETDLIRESLENTEWDFGEKIVTGLDMNAHWPFILTGYLILPHVENTNIKCDELSDNLRFLRWIYTDYRAKKSS
jgi:ABC-type phosphate transport system substrate-binding protein